VNVLTVVRCNRVPGGQKRKKVKGDQIPGTEKTPKIGKKLFTKHLGGKRVGKKGGGGKRKDIE